MKITKTLLILFIWQNTLFAQQDTIKKTSYTNDLPAYVIYNAKGEKVTFLEMMQELYKYDICLFGEMHDSFIAHWLEKMTTEQLVKEKGDKLVMGGEMWEADQQLLMDEFILQKYVDKTAYVETAKNWNNFRDYKPLLGIALRNNIKFVCSNIPRRYARVVYKKGIEYLDSLNQQAYQYLPPRPIHFDLTQPSYANMLSLFGNNDSTHKSGNGMSTYKGTNLVKAQAIKDATMAYNILKNWEKGKYFIHYNGAYHSKNYDGIFYYLKHYNPKVKVVTIHTWEVKNVMELPKEENVAHFNIMIPKTMPKTYD